MGYSTIEGFIDVTSGRSKLVEGSEPSNVDVTRPVTDVRYADYIPHPAFEFDGSKAGIWVGKFESSGSTSKVTIMPNTKSMANINVGGIFSACLGIKDIYKLTSDSHMMKNIEWGVVAYLTESKYGRNGIEIEFNNSNFFTGAGDYEANILQSTTGNVYGIYDINGGVREYIAGILENKKSNSNYYNFTNVDKKYYDNYISYSESKKIKGDAVYETSRSSTNSTSWNQVFSVFVDWTNPVFKRTRL